MHQRDVTTVPWTSACKGTFSEVIVTSRPLHLHRHTQNTMLRFCNALCVESSVMFVVSPCIVINWVLSSFCCSLLLLQACWDVDFLPYIETALMYSLEKKKLARWPICWLHHRCGWLPSPHPLQRVCERSLIKCRPLSIIFSMSRFKQKTSFKRTKTTGRGHVTTHRHLAVVLSHHAFRTSTYKRQKLSGLFDRD